MWELDYKENWAPKNCCFWTVILGKTFESPLDCKEIQPVHPKGNQSFTDFQYFVHVMWRTDSLEKPWCWERLNTGREGNDRGWDGCMTPPIWWIWIWARSGSWWWTGKPAVLQSMASQRFRHCWVTELNQTDGEQFGNSLID